MTSEIRANTLKNRVGLGTVEYTNTGIVVSGIVTATTFVGALTGTASGNPTLTNGADNRVITATSASAIQGEAGLTYNGSTFGVAAHTLNFTQSGNVTTDMHATGGDAKIILENTGNGNYSGIDFIRERQSATSIAGGSIFMKSDDSSNNALLYIQAQSASAQSPVTTALSADNGVRLILKGGDGIFAVETGASERFRIDNNGNLQVSTGQLTVGTTATTGLQLINDGTFGTLHSASLKLRTVSAERLRIDTNGRVIIGGTSAGPYHQDGDEFNIYSTGNTGMSIFSGNSSLGSLFFADDNNDVHGQRRGAIQYNHNGNYLAFWTNAGEKLRITSAGRVGIDRTSPNTMLDIKVPPLDTATITTTNCLQLGLLLTAGGTGSNTLGHIYNGLAVGDGYAGLYGKDGGTSAATDLEFFTGNASGVAGRMRIRDDGKIIIGGNVSQSINRTISVVAAQGNSQSVEIGLQPTNSSGGYNPEVYISSVADGTTGAQIGFHTRNTSGDRAERFGISSSGNIRWRNGSVLQRKAGAYLSIASAGTSDVKISGNFENNDMIRVRWAYNWNAGDGGAWGEAVIWKQYEGTKRVRYLTNTAVSPLSSVSFPHSGNDIWLRWQTSAGINGWYMIDVECHGCEPFPF